MKTIKHIQLGAVLLLSALSSTSFAVDGVIEINQTCAINGGCFAGDSAGFPVTITPSVPGHSFRLTSDLVQPNATTHAITIQTNDASLDLNGFTVTTTACNAAGATIACRPTSVNGAGINSTSVSGVSVKNGSVVGMAAGVFLNGPLAVVTNVHTRWNRYRGIAVTTGATVSGNTASGNVIGGIYAGDGSIVSDNTTSFNDADGIYAGDGSTAIGNTAYNNGGNGISAGAGAMIDNNTVRSNGNYGLNLDPSASYRNNTITGNTVGGVSGGFNRYSNYCAGTGVTNDFCP